MTQRKIFESFILGIFLCGGLIGMGYLVSDGLLEAKRMERTVTVKGLSEMEVQSDIAIWPISFSEADNDLGTLYATIKAKTDIITSFLKKNGFSDDDITVALPTITDREAQAYGDTSHIKFRYTATANISVYSTKVDDVRKAMRRIDVLIEKDIVLAGDEYSTRPQFLYPGLN